MGKVGNCQVAVTCVYADAQAFWPVGVRLYLPEEWTEDMDRWMKARVPPQEARFRTKPAIALEMLDKARRSEVPHACVVADSGYGDNPNFLAGLEERQERYVVGVHRDFAVQWTREGPVDRVDEGLAARPRRDWRTITWRQGSKGPLRKKFLAIRCWRVPR